MGLVLHVIRMHKESLENFEFTCDKCNQESSTEASMKNHLKQCGRQLAETPGFASCEYGKEVSKSKKPVTRVTPFV